MKVTLSNPIQISEGTLLFRIVDRKADKGLPSYRQQLKSLQPQDTVVLTNSTLNCDSKSVATMVNYIKAMGAQPVVLTQASDASEQNLPMSYVSQSLDVPRISLGSMSRDLTDEIRMFRF